MAEAIIRAQAVGWADDRAGRIELRLVDADGAEQRIVDEVRVLTTRDVPTTAPLPLEFWIRVDTGEIDGDRVRVTFADRVNTTDGRHGVEMSASDVRWL